MRTQEKVRNMVKNLCSLTEYLNSNKQTVGRNTNVKGASSEGSKGNEEHVFGNLMK